MKTPSQLEEQLKELHIREALDKQKLLESKKQNEVLRKELTELRSEVSQLEKARELNQDFFTANDRSLAQLKKRMTKDPGTHNAGNKSDFETLISKIRALQEDHKEAVSYFLAQPPNIPESQDADQFTRVLKEQFELFHQQLQQRQQAHEALHQRYYQSWVSVDSEIDSLINDVKRLVAERKQDLQTIHKLGRRQAMLEAGLDFQPDALVTKEPDSQKKKFSTRLVK